MDEQDAFKAGSNAPSRRYFAFSFDLSKSDTLRTLCRWN